MEKSHFLQVKNSHQLQMEFCLNVATRIRPKEDERNAKELHSSGKTQSGCLCDRQMQPLPSRM